MNAHGIAMTAERVFKAMTDATRRRILQLVARHELSVSDLVGCLGQPQSTVSRHLKVLRNADLIHDRRDGTAMLYAGDEPTVRVNGHDPSLPARVLDWVHEQPLPSAVTRRLDRVLRQRRQRSTDFFARIGDRWDRMRLEAFGDAFQFEALAALLPRDWIVADIGTGTGYLLPALAASFRRVIAVDPVPRMLDVARARCKARDVKNVIFKKGDLCRLPIQKQRVDLACAILVLHHVPSPSQAVRELAGVLKNGGRLLIVEQMAHDLADFYDRMQDRWWGFAPARLAKDVAAAGFDQVRWRRLSSDAPPAKAVEAPDLFVLTAQRKTRSAKSIGRSTE